MAEKLLLAILFGILFTISGWAAETKIPVSGKFYIEHNGQIWQRDYAELAKKEVYNDGMPRAMVFADDHGNLRFIQAAAFRGDKSSFDIVIDPNRQKTLAEKFDGLKTTQQAAISRSEQLLRERNSVPKTGKFYIEKNGRVLEKDFAEIANPTDHWVGMPEASVYRDPQGVLHYSVTATGRGTFDNIIDSKAQSALRTRFLKQIAVEPRTGLNSCSAGYRSLKPVTVF